MLRAVTIATLLGAAAYGGYWFFAKSTAETATQNAIANARALGYQISYDDLHLRGFPSRLDQTATNLSVTFPDGQSGVDLEWLQAFALSYRPNQVIIATPRSFDLRLGGQEIAIGNDDLKAQVDVGLDLALPLERAVIEGHQMRFTGGQWEVAADGLLAALRPAPTAAAGEHLYDIYAELRDIALPPAMAERLGATGVMPAALDGLRLTATARFAEALSLKAPPVLTEVTFSDASLNWGEAGLALSGTLHPDTAGRATGQVNVTLRNWTEVLDLAQAAGLLSADQQRLIGQGLQLLGGGAELTAPITLEGGQMRLGFLPLGPAPALPFTLPQ